MGNKIARVDAEAMDSLYASELAKVGMKTADAVSDDKGAPKDPQAFTDHADYLENLKSAMKADENVEGSDPNNKILD